MQCPICAALRLENTVECEAEATATLKRRSELVCSHGEDAATMDQLDRAVLRSRKRQAHIAFELTQHRANQHPIADVAKAASR
jgi:hypothetical protein